MTYPKTPERPTLLAWQRPIVEYLLRAKAEGRTEMRWVQGRRGGFWTMVKPESGNGPTTREDDQ